jgi:hypothetical protein
MESEFESRLLTALGRGERGAYGLFGKHGDFPESIWLPESHEGQALVELGQEIDQLRADLGIGGFALFATFMTYRARKDSNTPGDPKLAADFLRQIRNSNPPVNET